MKLNKQNIIVISRKEHLFAINLMCTEIIDKFPQDTVYDIYTSELKGNVMMLKNPQLNTIIKLCTQHDMCIYISVTITNPRTYLLDTDSYKYLHYNGKTYPSVSLFSPSFSVINQIFKQRIRKLVLCLYKKKIDKYCVNDMLACIYEWLYLL